ncbi:MAG: carboxypeptidase regulatory-like domain-containing protein [Candidatus Diapherotrites archaeon]
MGIYQSMEDKWYGFLDWLDDKGVHLYGVVDGIEKAGIPSFPLAVLIVLLLVIGSGWLIMGMIQPSTDQYNLIVEVSTLSDNPISGATVTAVVEGKTFTETSDSEGKAKFFIDGGGYANITATKEGYSEYSGGITVFETGETTTYATLSEITSHMTTIQFKDSTTGYMVSESLQVRFYCGNTEYDETKTVYNGEIDIEIPAGCNSFYADVLNSNFQGSGGLIDWQNYSTPIVQLQGAQKPKANVLVQIMDNEGNALEGITVSLKTSTGIEKNKGETGFGGTIRFQEVEENSYYIVASDIHGDYALFTSPTKAVSATSENTFTANMIRTIAGTLEVTVLDETTSKKIKDAPVRLILNNEEVAAGYTNSDGKVTFELDVNVRHNLEINHPDYLIATSEVLQNQTTMTVYLKKATSENSQAINVSVLDSHNKPIEDAKVSLMKSDGTLVGNMLTTGFDGLVNFRNLPAGFYHVEAMKTGFDSVKSEAIQVLPKQISNVELILPIGFGSVEINVLDSEKQPIQSAEITMIDLATDDEFDSGISDAQGKKIFDLRLDRTVYFEVDAPGYLKYHSIPMYGVDNTIVPVSFTLDTDVSSVELEFVGLYLNGEIVSNNTLSQGQKYNAMFRLKIPKGAAYREGGVHFRVGNDSEDRTSTLEEDSILIREIFSSSKWKLKGTSYTPSNGYSLDSGKLTTGDAKWVNVVWKDIDAGVYDMIAEVVVKDSASVGETLKLWYRGWAKSGSYVRDPYDETLGDSESTGMRQALYANANLMQYSIGPSNLCGNNFCKSFSIEDVERETKSVVLESYPAKNSSLYNLEFSISSISEKLLANSSIEIRSSGDSLRFDNYNIRGADGISHNSDESAYEITESAGDIGQGSVVVGTVSFKTEKEGANTLNIIIKSGKEEVFNRNIVIDVEASKEMHMEILPKALVPFIDNMMLVEVSTGTGEEERKLSAVQVSIYYEDELITIGETDSEGIYPYMLQAPSPGTIKVIAEKRGYKKIETEIKLNEDVLFVTPSEIRERFDASVDDELHVSVLVENYTPIPMTIQDLEFSNDFEGRVRFSLDDDYLDVDIAPKKENTIESTEEDEDSTLRDGQMQLDFTIELTDKGKLIEEPTKLEGTFTIYVTNKDSEKSWFTNIPVEVRIGLGNEVDDSRCIEIEPVDWVIITETEAKSMTFKIKNNCTVNEIPIVLRNLELAIESENENISGVFKAESIDFGAEGMEIRENFEVFAPLMNKNFSGEIEFTFTPDEDVESSASDVKLVVRATNSTPDGNEKIEVSAPIELSINNLAECVKIVGNKEITLTIAPTNLGWNQYQNYGYNPAAGGIPDAYGYGGGYDPGMQYSLPGYGSSMTPSQGYNTPYPQSQYDSSVYTYGQNPSMGWAGMFTGGNSYLPSGAADTTSYNQQMSQSSYSTDGFRIVNECTAPVEINLELVPAITTDESSFTLESNEEKDVVLNASQKMGIYPLKVKARLDGSKDKFKLVDELKIIVTYFEDLLQSGDCIKIIPPSKIALTDPFGRAAKLEVYNYCYDMGIRIATGSDGIEISCNVPNLGGDLSNPAYSGAIGGIPSGGMSSCPILEQPSWFMGERMSSGSNGHEQVVSFEVKPNLAFRQEVAKTLNENPKASLGFLRATVQAMVYYVNVRGNVHVNFRQQFGNSQSDFPIIIEDLWRLEEFGLTVDSNQQGPDGTEEPLPAGDGGIGIMSSCDATQTGENVYNKYGFDRLLFSWKWSDVTKNICDEMEITNQTTKKFCDATQFSISLSQKGKAIKDFIGNGSSLNSSETISSATGFETIANFKDTEHLYLWVKKLMKVTDDATGESYLFFLKNSDEILENEKLNINDSEFIEAQRIKDTYTDMPSVVTAMETLMTAVEGSANADEKDIIGIIDTTGTKFTTEEKTELETLQAGKPTNFNKHVITFNEYQSLHNALVAAGPSCLGADSCTVTIFDSEVTVTASLLQKIYNNITFHVGMRAKSTLHIREHEEEIVSIMQNAQDKEGITDSFKFWKENLRFDSYLIKDNYGDAGQYSKSKFRTRYLSYDNGELDAIGFENWNLTGDSSINDKAGKHYLFLNYEWEGDASFKLMNVKDRNELGNIQGEGKEYTNNIFFFKALNAGIADGKESMIISQTGGIQGGVAKLAESMSNFSESFNDVRDGWVLTVNGSTFNYEPSSPVNVLARISNETSGMFYEMDPEAGDIFLLQWKNGTLLKDRKESGTNIVRVCNNISTDEYGLSGNISANKRAIAYVPINVPTKLRMLCSGSEHSLSSREFTPEGSSVTGKTDTANVSRNITGDNAVLELNNTQMVNYYSIEKYLELIKTEKICVSEASSDVFKIYWNSDKFYNIAN